MSGELAGKTALVTGASRGIGLAIARCLAQQGARVAMNSRSAESLEAVCQQVENDPILAVGDVSSPENVEAVFHRVLAGLGRLDILVNNAAITQDGLAMLMRPDTWQQVLSVNLGGPFHCSRAALRAMLKRRSGSIINLVSPAAFLGKAGASNYAAAKAGLVALTKSLAAEAGRGGIRVNAVCPGFIETDMIAGMPEAERGALLERIPLGRFGSPSDVAEAVSFLASERARYITGTTVVVDGGLTML